MGWLRTILLGDIGNRLDIEDSEREIEQLKSAARWSDRQSTASQERLDSVIAQNAELKLYLAATLRLLMEKGVVSREDIQVMINRVDQQDGKTDGKYSGPIV
jgi:multidrug resistance efflux pump